LEVLVRFVVRSLCCVALAGATAGAQKVADPRDALVVSTAWLAQHLKDPDLVVLFLGDDNDYNSAHIPGAHNMQLEDFAFDDTSRVGLSLQMLPPARLRDRLGAFGITDRSRIVVYTGKGFLEYGTRVVLTLDYAGLGSRTSLLDGGAAAWANEGRQVTDVVPAKHESALGALRVKPIIVDAQYVKARIGKPGVSIVDGRAPAFYGGVSTGGRKANPHRTGHIASAKSVPFTAPYGDGDFVRPTAELRSLFANAGIAAGDTVIGYCHIGLQATAMLFAARLLGHPVRLYDGSFEDWSRQPAAEYPVETVSGRNKP
jgi:thiosulfate/3-mercaptopyruvate sulfurtransferase